MLRLHLCRRPAAPPLRRPRRCTPVAEQREGLAAKDSLFAAQIERFAAAGQQIHGTGAKQEAVMEQVMLSNQAFVAARGSDAATAKRQAVLATVDQVGARGGEGGEGALKSRESAPTR